MRYSIKILILIAALFASNFQLKAQPNTLYFMKGLPQIKELNPARLGLEDGFYISMPLLSNFDLSLNTNNWSFGDVVQPGSGLQQDLLVWDFENLINAFDKKNFVQQSVAITLLDFGWKKEKSYFSFSVSENEVLETFFKKELAELIYYGNFTQLGSTYHSGYFGLSAQHYRQFAFTYSKELNKKLNVGVTGKLLFGKAGVETRGLNLVAGMPASGEQINTSLSGNVHTSLPIEVRQNPANYFQFAGTSSFEVGSYFFNFGNPGLAVDLGLSSKISEKLELSISLIDLGVIRWRNGLSTFEARGNYPYEGINLNNLSTTQPANKLIQPLVHELRDSIMVAFPPKLSAAKFSTLLPIKLYIGGEYNLGEHLSFGGLARVRLYNNQLHTSYTASVNTSVGKTLSFTAAYSLYETTMDNLGLGMSFKVGPAQIYVVSDNVISPFYLVRSKNTNLRFGINLIFREVNRIEKRHKLYMPSKKYKLHRG